MVLIDFNYSKLEIQKEDDEIIEVRITDDNGNSRLFKLKTVDVNLVIETFKYIQRNS